MTKTTNYQLNQWAKSDRVMMDDFNADNAKIDAALKANADGSITNVKMLHVVLYPMGHTEANVCGMILGTDAPKLFTLGSEWSGASMLHVRFDNGAASFLPATRIVIWGKK